MRLSHLITLTTLFVGLFGNKIALASEGPCRDIVEACKNAGFVKGDAYEGTGLWLDCVKPIMTGQKNPAAKKPLPQVEAAKITACKQQRPHFGQEMRLKPQGQTN
jgi:hypothetical protein